MSFVSHVECTICSARHDAKRVLTVCERCGQMLAVRYNLSHINASVTKDALRARPHGMYRFRELIPLEDGEEPITLGEGGTPLLELPRLAAHLGVRKLWAKDEGQNPTGSFKARGLGMAITRGRTLGARGFVIPSAGNAGGAAAVYAARCGLPCVVIVPRGTPAAAVAEAQIAGAHVFTIEGSIATAGRVVAQVAPQLGWFDLSTLKEPYRLEGKKKIGVEIAEQLDWRMPDVLLYPTGGGTGLVGIPKGYEELRSMEWVSGALPRLFAGQGGGRRRVARGDPQGLRGAPVDGVVVGAASAAVRGTGRGLRAGREGLRRGRGDDDGVGEPDHARRRAPGAVAVCGSSDASPPARYAGRRDGRQREGDPGRPASRGAHRGCLDRPRVGRARRRARHPQRSRRGPP